MINDDDSLYETMRHHSKIVLYQMMNLMQMLNNKPYSQKVAKATVVIQSIYVWIIKIPRRWTSVWSKNFYLLLLGR